MNKEPKVLTRMRLSCCWGDNLNEKELNEVVDYINNLQQENKRQKDNWNKLKDIVKSQSDLKLKCKLGNLWFEVDELLEKMEEIEKGEE